MGVSATIHLEVPPYGAGVLETPNLGAVPQGYFLYQAATDPFTMSVGLKKLAATNGFIKDVLLMLLTDPSGSLVSGRCQINSSVVLLRVTLFQPNGPSASRRFMLLSLQARINLATFCIASRPLLS